MSEMSLHARIALVQQDLGSEVTTDKVGGRNNRYPSLLKGLTDAIPACIKAGIAVTQPCAYYPESNVTTVKTILTDIGSGEQEVSEMALDTSNGGQATGSLLTYYRRYLLLSALSLAPGGVEEDDAEFLEIKHQELQLARKTLRAEFDKSGLSWSDVCKGVGVSPNHIPSTVDEVRRYRDFIQKESIK
jgi:hypothetical protein